MADHFPQHIPRKRFGQHFLHDQQVIRKIIQAIAPLADEHLVEIGPGQGALTAFILPLTGKLDVIELDRDLIPHLVALGKTLGELTIHQGDALKFDFAQLVKNKLPLRIFGNLPYNISTPLIFHLLDYVSVIKDMHFMLQKEVADRLSAMPGTEHYSRLSVMTQYYCRTQTLFIVGPKSFTPPPKVESAFIRMIPTAPVIVARNLTKFQEVVRLAFGQRRKMLHNSLKNIISSAQLETLGIAPDIRPERLKVEDFVRISNIISDDE